MMPLAFFNPAPAEFCFFPRSTGSNAVALPPHATLEQTKNMLLAMARGDKDRKAVMAQIYKQLAASKEYANSDVNRRPSMSPVVARIEKYPRAYRRYRPIAAPGISI